MKTVKNSKKYIFVIFVVFVLAFVCQLNAKSVRLQVQTVEPNDLKIRERQIKAIADFNNTGVQTSDANSRPLRGYGITVLKKKLTPGSKASMQKDVEAHRTAEGSNKSHVIRCELITDIKPIKLTKHRVPIDSNSQIHPVPDINTVSR